MMCDLTVEKLTAIDAKYDLAMHAVIKYSLIFIAASAFLACLCSGPVLRIVEYYLHLGLPVAIVVGMSVVFAWVAMFMIIYECKYFIASAISVIFLIILILVMFVNSIIMVAKTGNIYEIILLSAQILAILILTPRIVLKIMNEIIIMQTVVWA